MVEMKFGWTRYEGSWTGNEGGTTDMRPENARLGAPRPCRYRVFQCGMEGSTYLFGFSCHLVIRSLTQLARSPALLLTASDFVPFLTSAR